MNKTTNRMMSFHLAVLGGYTILSCLFFFFVLFSDKTLVIHDNLLAFFPSFLTENKIWVPGLQFGFPLYASAQSQLFYPLLYLFPKSQLGFNLYLILHVVMAGYFMCLLSYRITEHKLGSFIAGMIFAYCGSMVGQMTMAPVPVVSAWMPLVILCVYRMVTEPPSLLSLGALALVVCLVILGGHPQFFVHIMLLAGIMTLFFLRQDSKFKWQMLVYISLAVLLGVLMAAMALLPLMELLQYTKRSEGVSYTSFTGYSMLWGQLIRIAYPYIHGSIDLNSSILFRYNYATSGEHIFHETHRYFGLLALLLAPVGWVAIKNKQLKYFITFAIVFYFLYALGNQTPFSKLLFKIPVLNSFRGAARHFLELTLIFSLLTAAGIKLLGEQDSEKLKKFCSRYWLALSLFLTVLPFLVIYLTGPFASAYKDVNWFSFFKNNLISVQILLLFTLTGLLFLYLYSSRLKKFIPAALLLLCFVDLYVNAKAVDWQFSRQQNLMEILETNKALYKSLDKPLFFNYNKGGEHKTYYDTRHTKGPHALLRTNLTYVAGVKSVKYYDPLSLKSWKEIHENPRAGELWGLYGAGFTGHRYAMDDIPYFAQLRGNCNLFSGQLPPETKQETYRLKLPTPLSGKLRLHTNIACWNPPLKKGQVMMEVELKSAGNKMAKTLLTTHRDSWSFNLPCAKLPELKPETSLKLDKKTCLGIYAKELQLPEGGPVTEFTTRVKPGYLVQIYAISMEKKGKRTYLVPTYLKPGELDKPFYLDKHTVINRIEKHNPEYYLVDHITPAKEASISDLLGLAEEQEPGQASKRAIVNIREAVSPAGIRKLAVKPKKHADLPGHVSLVKERSTSIELKSEANRPAMLVLNHTYYPGWNAFIDGKQAEIYRVNNTVRGVLVPEGAHIVTFEYRPLALYIGLGISMAGFVLLILILLFGFLRMRTRRASNRAGVTEK